MDAKRTSPVSDDDRAQVAKIVDEQGEGEAERLLELPRATLSRVLAHQSVRAGTRLVLRQALERISRGS
jgi:hypothetical protein